MIDSCCLLLSYHGKLIKSNYMSQILISLPTQAISIEKVEHRRVQAKNKQYHKYL